MLKQIKKPLKNLRDNLLIVIKMNHWLNSI